MQHSLVPLYRKMHADAHFCGRSIYAYTAQISELVIQSGAKTLLDYGSGKGRQYYEGNIHQLWGGIMPSLYDPAVDGIDKHPVGPFDGVICTDVMEHIPETELIETLDDLRRLATMWVFFSICCEPAKKTLPDGRNVHVTLHQADWWIEMIQTAFDGGPEAHIYFDRPKEKVKPSTARKLKDEWYKRGWKK